MNTLVMFKKFSEDNVDGADNVTLINSSKTLEEFKAMFDQSVAAFVNKLIEMNVFVNQSNAQLSQEDYDSDEITEKMKVFSNHYEAYEKFAKENFVFEFEGQYLNMKNWFWNDKFFYEYEIYYLEDWVKDKLAKNKEMPSYHF